MIVVMVRIPVGSAEEGARLEERFRNRLGAVDSQPGFLGFELLKGEGEREYISVTRWASRADLDRWTNSEAHVHAHTRPQAPTSGGHPHAEDASAGATGSTPSGQAASSTTVYEVVIPGGKDE